MHPWIVRHLTFPLYRRVIGERALACLKELEQTQWYSLSQLRDLQLRKLKGLLAHCYDNVPYYRALFDELAIKPEDIKGMDDFRRLPFLTKHELRHNLPQILAQDRGRPFIRERTSGSSGIPTEVQIDRLTSAYHFAAQARGRRWWGWDIGEKNVWLWGSLGPWHEVRRFKRRLADNTILFSVYDLGPRSMRDYYQRMRHFKPRFMYGFTSALYALAKFVKEDGLDGRALGLKGVCTTSEILYPHQREMIETAFGCPVINEYGCTEVGIIAFQCPEGGMHLSSENILVEFIRDGKPAQPGQMASIVVTDLNNRRMPLVRYRTGDVGCYSARLCPCGRGLPLMEVSVGREVDLIRLRNGKVLHPETLTLPHDSLLFEKIRQYKIFQRSLSLFFIQIEAEPGSESLVTNGFSRFVRDKLGEEVAVEFEFVECIPRERSGKLRYFVSELNTERCINGTGPRWE